MTEHRSVNSDNVLKLVQSNSNCHTVLIVDQNILTGLIQPAGTSDNSDKCDTIRRF